MLLVHLFRKYIVFCFELNTWGRGETVVRALDSHQFGLVSGLAMYAIYGLGTGRLGAGSEDFRGDYLFFGRTKGGISCH